MMLNFSRCAEVLRSEAGSQKLLLVLRDWFHMMKCFVSMHFKE